MDNEINLVKSMCLQVKPPAECDKIGDPVAGDELPGAGAKALLPTATASPTSETPVHDEEREERRRRYDSDKDDEGTANLVRFLSKEVGELTERVAGLTVQVGFQTKVIEAAFNTGGRQAGVTNNYTSYYSDALGRVTGPIMQQPPNAYGNVADQMGAFLATTIFGKPG